MVSSKFVATYVGFLYLFETLIIYSWISGIFSIGTYLDKSPLSINKAFDDLHIFFKSSIAFNV